MIENIRIGMVSLGCAKNLVDTEIALGYLVKSGATLVDQPGDADVIVVNTCGFIGPAKEESIETILEMAQYKERGSCRGLIVTGCLSGRYKQDLADEIPEIDGLLGTGEMDLLPQVIIDILGGRKVVEIKDEFFSYDDMDIPRLLSHRNGSAYLKIAEGCSHTCAFCVIPQIRGPLRSRKMRTVVEEARRLVTHGVRELNVIAQDTTAYGQDGSGENIGALLRELDQQVEVDWIRMLYAYPTTLTDEVLDIMASSKKILPYLDIPLQHASTDMLRAMHRPGTYESQLLLLERIRNLLPNAVVRTSFIVGFPGETQQDFDELLRFLEEARFHRVGVFAFSREEDTLAFSMPNQISQHLKDERRDQAMAVQQQISFEHNQRLVGTTQKVLIEGPSAESELVVTGRYWGQAPEVDGQIYLGNSLLVPGSMYDVRVTEAHAYDLVGELVEEAE